MAFLRLPNRSLQYPSVGRVPLLPPPIVKPNLAVAISQAIPGLLAAIDPVERAKRQAQVAYYNYLQSNPTGLKPMTEYQRNMLGIANSKLALAQAKNAPNPIFDVYKNALSGHDHPTVPMSKPPVQVLSPRPQGYIGNSPLGGNDLSIGQPLTSSGDLSGVDTTGLDSQPTVDNSVDTSAITNQLLTQNPGLNPREAYLLATQDLIPEDSTPS